MADDNVFEIGLVMAGAISAGAYTAGVMDFLIEALDAYEAAKKQPDWDGPTHSVRVPLMAGASAGGMTSAMCALQAFHDMKHVAPGAPPPAPDDNRLYSNWVTRIDLKRLLETSDLDNGQDEKVGVRSVLCCTILDEIVKETFSLSGPPSPRAWLGRGDDHSLRVLVTLTNLRGVPYSFQVFGDTPLPYAMLNHGDYLDFKIGSKPALAAAPAPPGVLELAVDEPSQSEWSIFREAALGTGAFPIGLAPRTFARKGTDYDVSYRVGRDSDNGFKTIPPNEIMQAVDPFNFVAVDGGTIDNEPLEIGRRLLEQSGQIKSNGDEARKAIVLIAPFPNFLAMPPQNQETRIVDVAPQLATTLIQQSRFKADELARATDTSDFSRFLIAPSRPGKDGKESPLPIASGCLNGFGGFIDESFRRHDYLLGRRNAQAFLRYHFALPKDHPFFAGKNIDTKWYVEKPPQGGPSAKTLKTFATKLGSEADAHGFPIIPLFGSLRDEIVIGASDLPRPENVDQGDLGKRIDKRAARVVGTLVDYDLIKLTEGQWFGGVSRLFAKRYLTQILSKKAKAKIKDAVAAVDAAFS